jgi:hypothetical protein
MTRQIQNIFIFENKPFTIIDYNIACLEVSAKAPLLYEFLAPLYKALNNFEGGPTSCRCGYHFQYFYDEKLLYLQNIMTYLDLLECPIIYGMEATSNPRSLFGSDYGSYINLDLPISQYCSFVIGEQRYNFIPATLPSPYPIEFKIVYYLEFKNGSLIKKIDMSDKVEMLRQEFRKDPVEFLYGRSELLKL